MYRGEYNVLNIERRHKRERGRERRGSWFVVCRSCLSGNPSRRHLDTNVRGGEYMHPVTQRLALLWWKQKSRPLTDDENKEMIHCLDATVMRAWKLAHLENLSYMASLTKDTEWLHELCKEIDQLNDSVK